MVCNIYSFRASFDSCYGIIWCVIKISFEAKYKYGVQTKQL